MTNKYYLSYATANDDDYFSADCFNFINMIKYNPGVKNIFLFIAISEVQKFTLHQKKIFSLLLNKIDNCPWITLKEIIIKNNIGRDFSSTKYCLKAISKTANIKDYVMIRNRSGYGPFSKFWYKNYINQFNKTNSMGLVGSTINFSGHPSKKIPGIKTHVQTYVYLSTWACLSQVYTDFPGSLCTNRIDLINKGEIGLSNFFIKRGYDISCLFWPSEIFNIKNHNSQNLPQKDIKKFARNLPIIYKYESNFKILKIILWKIYCLTYIRYIIYIQQYVF